MLASKTIRNKKAKTAAPRKLDSRCATVHPLVDIPLEVSTRTAKLQRYSRRKLPVFSEHASGLAEPREQLGKPVQT
jgi:hypothetical protein